MLVLCKLMNSTSQITTVVKDQLIMHKVICIFTFITLGKVKYSKISWFSSFLRNLHLIAQDLVLLSWMRSCDWVHPVCMFNIAARHFSESFSKGLIQLLYMHVGWSKPVMKNLKFYLLTLASYSYLTGCDSLYSIFACFVFKFVFTPLGGTTVCRQTHVKDKCKQIVSSRVHYQGLQKSNLY